MANKPARMLGIAASLRRETYHRAAQRAATKLAPEGAVLETFDLDGIPGFSQDEEQNPPKKIVELKRQIRAAERYPVRDTGIQLLSAWAAEECDRLDIETLR